MTEVLNIVQKSKNDCNFLSYSPDFLSRISQYKVSTIRFKHKSNSVN